MSLEPLLEVQGISKTFNGLRVLKNVGLKVYPSEIQALMGIGIYTIFRDWRVPLWRAGLSNRRTARVGLRSSPKTSLHRASDTPRSSVLGQLRSPTRDKPARHNSPICRAFSVEQKLCRYPCLDGGEWRRQIDPDENPLRRLPGRSRR
jgi:hypothetical protein